MGRILGAFGVQGWIRMKTFTAQPGALADYPGWIVQTPAGWREMTVEEFAVRPRAAVAKLAGCDDREAAERLRNAEVAVPREWMGEAGEGELFWVDLVGLEVVDEGGVPLGKVEGLFESGETSVMVVRGTRERMIPFVADYVKGVDRKAGRITVEWKADYDA